MNLDSQEKIKKPTSPSELENKENQIIDNLKKSQKKKLMFNLLLITFILILIVAIGAFLFLK